MFLSYKHSSVVPLVVFGLLAPQAVLEQEDDQNEERGDDDDGAGHGVAVTNSGDDGVLAAALRSGADGLSEEEKSVLAEAGAAEFGLKTFHKSQVGVDLTDLLLILFLGHHFLFPAVREGSVSSLSSGGHSH